MVKRLLLCFILLFSFLIQMIAQIRGVVKDADTGEPISYLNVFYVEKAVGAITYMDERTEIQRVIEWKERTFSSIGYEAIIVPISAKTKDLAVFMKPFYRKKSGKRKKSIVKGINSTGVNELFNTGDIMTTVLKDVFQNVNVYEDRVRLI